MQESGELNMAFVYLSSYLDLIEAIDEPGGEQLDNFRVDEERSHAHRMIAQHILRLIGANVCDATSLHCFTSLMMPFVSRDMTSATRLPLIHTIMWGTPSQLNPS